jgi:hypothetical protein
MQSFSLSYHFYDSVPFFSAPRPFDDPPGFATFDPDFYRLFNSTRARHLPGQQQQQQQQQQLLPFEDLGLGFGGRLGYGFPAQPFPFPFDQ